MDVESPHFVAEVKHIRRFSLAQLEALAVEMALLGAQRGKVGVVVVKRRAGRGDKTPRLIFMTAEGCSCLTWESVKVLLSDAN